MQGKDTGEKMFADDNTGEKMFADENTGETEEKMFTEENNLELFLNDVFQKECVYRISQEEVEFIQKGIEYLVEQIVRFVLEDIHRDQTDKKFSPPVPLLDHARILKVGSFYEGTKNRFPDEFDFLFCFYMTRKFAAFHNFRPPIESYVRGVCRKKGRGLKYSKLDGRKIWLNEFKEEHGPASWLLFTYKDKLSQNHEINVDLVPASKLYLDPEINTKNVDDICEIKPFVQEIWSTLSILIVKNNFSFTETEVDFMNMTLSENHRKVYRIIKFLINGHGDEKYVPSFVTGYSSYKIKTKIVSHHYKCRNSHKSGLGNCVLDVLEDIARHRDEFPTLVMPEKIEVFFPELDLQDDLKALISRLRAMQNQTSGYDYSRDGIVKSVTKQYYDKNREETENDGIDSSCTCL